MPVCFMSHAIFLFLTERLFKLPCRHRLVRTRLNPRLYGLSEALLLEVLEEIGQALSKRGCAEALQERRKLLRGRPTYSRRRVCVRTLVADPFGELTLALIGAVREEACEGQSDRVHFAQPFVGN